MSLMMAMARIHTVAIEVHVSGLAMRGAIRAAVVIWALYIGGAAYAQNTATSLRLCDELAASPYDSARPTGIGGVESSEVDVQRALTACEAIRSLENPSPSQLFQLGRVLHLANREAEARTYYNQAAAAGHLVAKHNIGELLLKGYADQPANLVAALQYLEAAALGGVSISMRSLAYIFRYGNGVPVNRQKAERWFRAAVEAGDIEARVDLSDLLVEDSAIARFADRNSPTKWDEAGRLLRVAATHRNRRAIQRLIDAIRAGDLQPTSASEIESLYTILAEAGDAAAMVQVANLIKRRATAPADNVVAFEWYLKAAKKGDTAAMVMVAEAMIEGTGTPKDERTAIRWYQRAANDGDARSMGNLAIAFMNGTGVTADHDQAGRWAMAALRTGSDYILKSLTNDHANWHIETRKAIQRRLANPKYNTIRVSGHFDEATHEAIRRIFKTNSEKRVPPDIRADNSSNTLPGSIGDKQNIPSPTESNRRIVHAFEVAAAVHAEAERQKNKVECGDHSKPNVDLDAVIKACDNAIKVIQDGPHSVGQGALLMARARAFLVAGKLSNARADVTAAMAFIEQGQKKYYGVREKADAYGLRAAINFRLQSHTASIEDASEAWQLDKGHVKRQREWSLIKADAMAALGQNKDAQQWYQFYVITATDDDKKSATYHRAQDQLRRLQGKQ